MSKVNINEIKKGDIFSESSYYAVSNINKDTIEMKMIGSDKEIVLSNEYVQNFLSTADQYQSEVKVGKLDKVWTAKQIEEATKKGTLTKDAVEGSLKQKGIKSLWSEVGNQVITVCFVKKGTTLSDNAYKQLVDIKVAETWEQIEATKTAKKGVANKALEVLADIIHNPISKEIPGEPRVLRGAKASFESEDGHYQMMEILQDGTTQLRPVNLNTFQWLVVDGVKYIVE
jgi:hypothetical protein